MKRFVLIMVSTILATAAAPGARAATTFDFRSNGDNQFYNNGAAFEGTFGENIFAYGFHLFYDLLDVNGVQALQAREVKAVGVTRSSKGLGVRDPNIGNNEGRESKPYEIKQELLVLQFASPDWRPVEVTTRAGRDDTGIFYAANGWDISLPQDADSFVDGIFNDMVALEGGAFALDLDALLPDGGFQFLGIASKYLDLAFDGSPGDDDGNKFSVQSVVGIVPVPASLPLGLTGLLGLILLARRRKVF